jgi:ubiquinone/menaquinone biosynthesis C-methylase UbiE
MRHPKDIVARGYDHIAERYAAWSQTVRVEERERYTQVLSDRLPSGADVLDLGCGAGLTTGRLAERFVVTGVDISERQIQLARRNVPLATFVQADMTTLAFPPATFDAVAAFYSITHVPCEEHSALLRNIATWLRPGGLLVASLAAGPWTGSTVDDWLGTPMYFSHRDGETSMRLVREAGLEILSARDETANEDGDPVTFLWIVAQKPNHPPGPPRDGSLPSAASLAEPGPLDATGSAERSGGTSRRG